MKANTKVTCRGYTILEIIIALSILLLVMLVVGETVGLVAQQRRTTQRRQLATQTAENLMEHQFARPWNELTAEKLAEEKLSPEAERELVGGTLKVDVEELAGPPAAKRLRIEVGWTDGAGPVPRPVRITAWRYGE